ncbi:MAG TPA: hypothetical protein DDW50_21265 [Firmicutes bacterium]|jgi:hypothetical protein|nr:hypothetical protein [Bacillota bacterium]
MNRLTDFQKRMIVLGIAAFMILLGVAQALIKTDFFTKHKQLMDEGTFILMLIAAVLLFSKKKSKPDTQNPSDNEKQVQEEKIAEQDQAKESK